jgi:hypothetical protein
VGISTSRGLSTKNKNELQVCSKYYVIFLFCDKLFQKHTLAHKGSSKELVIAFGSN